MATFDEAIAALAESRGRRIVTRAEALSAGGNDELIERRLTARQWGLLHAGVYLIGVGPLTWEERVLAAALGGGPTAVASHRAAMSLWGISEFRRTPVEITITHASQTLTRPALVHRSRRLEPISWVHGIPTTSPERTLLESGQVVPPIVTERAFAAAWRKGLTTPQKCLLYCRDYGGKGRTGTRRLRAIAAEYDDGHRPPGSDREVVLWRLLAPALDGAGIESPVRQFEIPLLDGSVAVVDACWPLRRRVIEVAGLSFHGDFRRHDYDVERQAAIETAGYRVRLITPRSIRERPDATVARLVRFLQR